MSIKNLIKRVLPDNVVSSITRARRKMKQEHVASLPLLSEDCLRNILANELGVTEGNTVFVHSSVDQLNLGFPFYRILTILQQMVGPSGTILFPTYPPMSSYEFLSRGETFDIRKSPSYTGLLTEFARRQRGAIRSLHPTKSVCALGRYARELTATHQLSPYPYDSCSPYYKLIECQAKIIGIGVSTENLSFVHCVDDAMKEAFPVRPYQPRLFAAQCINYQGELEVVRTYAHDLEKMNHDIPRYMSRHVPHEACRDLELKGMPFFRADAAKLFDAMLRLAKDEITIYPATAYSKSRPPEPPLKAKMNN